MIKMIKKLIQQKENLEKKLDTKEKNHITNKFKLKEQEAKIYTETNWKDEEHKKYTNKELKEAYIQKKLHQQRLTNEQETQEIQNIKRQIENITFQIKYIIEAQ